MTQGAPLITISYTPTPCTQLTFDFKMATGGEGASYFRHNTLGNTCNVAIYRLDDEL